MYPNKVPHLSCVVEKKASGAISVLSISWVETLLTYQGSLLVTNTLREGGEGQGGERGRDWSPFPFPLSLSLPPSLSPSLLSPSPSLLPFLSVPHSFSLSLLPLPFPFSLPLLPSFPPSHPDEPCVDCSKEAVSFLHGFNSIWTVLHHPLDLHGTEVCADWQSTARLKQYQKN